MRFLTIALLLGVLSPLAAQNLTAPLLSGSWQSSYHNPAMTHFLPGRLTIGLPGIANDLRLENVNYPDVFVEDGGATFLDFGTWSRLSAERNDVQNIYSVETLGLALRLGNTVVSGYHRLRVIGEANYPGDLIDVIALGNAPFIGEPLEIAPTGEIVAFQEIGASLSYALSEHVALAGRLKYLAGASAIQTVPGGSLRLTTEEENYTLSLEQDLTINTSGALAYQSLEEPGFDYNPGSLDLDNLSTDNSGIAFDLGIAMNFDRLRLNASATDLGGSIDWEEGVTNLRFSGTQTFSGLDILSDLLLDTVSLASAVDTLLQTFEPGQSRTAFSTELGAAYYLGGEYDLTERITAGAMVLLEDRLGETKPAYALMARLALFEWLQVGANLNHRSGIRTNIGLHLYATPGRFRLFASSDKVFTLASRGSTALAGIRLGAAWSLGSRERRSVASFRP